MEKKMVKENSLGMMVESMGANSRVEQNGIEWNRTYYDKDVKIKDKFVKGKFKNP